MKTIASLGLALALCAAAVAPASAQPINPTGVWKSATGESKYEIILCGPDGAQLCAKLVWLSEAERTEKNLPYLGSYLLENAAPTRENQWAGQVRVYDQSLAGTITLVDANTIDLTGCLLVVFCKTFYLNRES